MSIKSRISAFVNLGHFFTYIANNQENKNTTNEQFEKIKEETLSKFKLAEIQNPWFTQENILFCIRNWGEILTEVNLTNWVESYEIKTQNPKNVGIIMAGNIPLVGLHDLISVLLSGNHAIIKSSSKDDVLMNLIIDFLQKQNSEFVETIQKVDRLNTYDAVIATGSNNTARYFEFYFKNTPSIIRKNRTSISVLDGSESKEELKLLAEDVFRYFGLGCRNVTHLFLPKGYNTDLIFEAFYDWNHIINHTKYANNYDYNRAIYLMAQEKFLDNNFVVLKNSDDLFSPIGVIHFSYYDDLEEIKTIINEQTDNIQCISTKIEKLYLGQIQLGQTQKPSLTDYADGIDTMKFLENL